MHIARGIIVGVRSRKRKRIRLILLMNVINPSVKQVVITIAKFSGTNMRVASKLVKDI